MAIYLKIYVYNRVWILFKEYAVKNAKVTNVMKWKLIKNKFTEIEKNK